MKMLHYFKNPEEDSDSESLNDMRLEVEEFLPPYDPSDSSLSDDIFLGDTDDEAEELLYEMDSESEYSMDDSESENSTKTEYKSKMKLDEEKPTTSNSADGKTEPGRSGEKGDEEKTLDGITKKRSRIVTRSTSKELHAPPEIVLEDFITDICFHPERNIIALATIIGDIHLYKYDKDENKLLRSIEVHGKACRDVEFSEDGKDLLTCSKDKSIMITDMATEKLKKFYESAHDDAINKIHVINDNLFVSGDDGGTIKLWDLRTKDAVFALKEVEDYITQMLTNDAKKLLLVTSGDGYLTTINLSARKLYVQSEPYEEELTCMGLYRGDTKLVVGTTKGRLYTYNWGQFGYHCDMYPGIKNHIGVMLPLTDRIACVAGEEGNLLACHIAPFRILGVIGQHNMPVEFLDISNTGEIIASSSHNNDVHFWNIKYLEEFTGIKCNEKHNTFKEKSHNLPSSNCINPTDFFAGLEKESSDDE